jgi:hypothetical protein
VPESGEEDYATPEDVARGDIPERFVTILAVRVEGETAHVWSLTNDQPPFEPYEDWCERNALGRWEPTHGSGGFSLEVPPEVLEKARRLGWS